MNPIVTKGIVRMTRRRLRIFLLLCALGSLGASHRTAHFIVVAPDEEVARKVGEKAEHCRKQLALKWIGTDLPDEGEPCLVEVTLTARGCRGGTTTAFRNGEILWMRMRIEGPLDELLRNVVPHEVTHVVFASLLRAPAPRWADEGGAILSEDPKIQNYYDDLMGKLLDSPTRHKSLRGLFRSGQYTQDYRILYAQGYSISRFLIASRGRTKFVAFVAAGMRGDWDEACKHYYGYESVEEMERAWLHSEKVRRKSEQIIEHALSAIGELRRAATAFLNANLLPGRQQVGSTRTLARPVRNRHSPP
jgi:hypothetical protein